MAERIQRRSAECPEAGLTLVEAEAVRNLRNNGLYIHLRMAEPECWHGRRPVPRYISGEIGEFGAA